MYMLMYCHHGRSFANRMEMSKCYTNPKHLLASKTLSFNSNFDIQIFLNIFKFSFQNNAKQP